MSLTVQELQHAWLQYDKFEHTRKELQQLDEKELRARMEPRIDFGTAGLRAKMAAGFACMNELGLATYIEQVQPQGKQQGIVIGYDGRYNSKLFADLTAAVFVAKNFKVFLYPHLVPTPFVPYAVSHLKAAAGIMVTASHNPKQDNGYKLYWNNGCQIISPIDAEVSKLIMQNLAIWDSVDITCASLKNNALIVQEPLAQVIESYYKQSGELYCFEKNTTAKRNEVFTYTAMHGVGAKWTQRAFETFGLPAFVGVKEQLDPNPDFPTVAFPNPEEGKGALKLAIETADKHNSRLILANDPDADRLAVAEKQKDGTWRILNGNEIALLLAHWAFTHFVKNHANVDLSKCFMLSSTVSSKILQAMAQVEGFHWEDTLTGFKWIGNRADALIKQGLTFIFGFEVEIGFLVGDISLDKDGVRCAAIFAEMAYHVYNQFESLVAFMDHLYAKYGYYMMKTRYFFTPTPAVVKTVMDNIRVMNSGTYPSQIGNYKIKYIRDLTVGYDNSQPNNKPVLPVSASSQMITFTFEDGSVCTLRNSGTEPKLKWYVEVCDKSSKAAAIAKVEDLTKTVIADLLQPSKFGLVPPKDE